MRDLIRNSIIINTVGGWLVFVSVLGIIYKLMPNAYVSLVILLPVIIMVNFANYCFNNYIESQKTIDDFVITSEIKSEQK